jgi:uroporphyrinogen decarboxylase
MITHRSRLETCLSGNRPDRTPVAFWRHFPVDDQHPGRLAAASLAFQKTFDFDLVKVTPASSYCITDWGARDAWRGAAEGTREYTYRVIQSPIDWARLPVLEPTRGALNAQIECLRLINSELDPATPVIQTIFNPLSQAKNLVGGANLIVHLRKYPDLVEAGLRIITDSILRFIEAAARTGIAGIFLAVQHAQYGLLTEAEYDRFGRRYDLQILEAVRPLWLNMLHLHGVDVMFDHLSDYPVQIINWHDRETGPSLVHGKSRFSGVVCGGLQRDAVMLLGDPDLVATESLRSIAETNGERFILSTGCVLQTTTPYGNIMTARRSVEST